MARPLMFDAADRDEPLEEEHEPNYGTIPELLVTARTGLPESSWWAGAAREGFTALAESQTPRMSRSKLARSRLHVPGWISGGSEC